MSRVIAVLLALALCGCALPAAKYESNFGRVILARCDLIAMGVVSAVRKQVGAAIKAEFTIQDVIFGAEDQKSVIIIYHDRKLLKEGESVRGMYALKSMAGSGYSIVGKPMIIPESDAEGEDKVAVARAFVELEARLAGKKRVQAFVDLLLDHIRTGGYWARNAAIELIFLVQNRVGLVNRDRFDLFRKARTTALKRLDRQTKQDLNLAFQGMVESRMKRLAYKKIKRGKTAKERLEGVKELEGYLEEYPRAFSSEDVEYCEAVLEELKGASLKSRVAELARDIDESVLALKKQAGKREKAERKRVRHAKGD